VLLSQREAATACAALRKRGFRIGQFVTNCGGERLPCNYLYVSSVTFMSVTVQFLYTLLIYVLFPLYDLAFRRLALT